MVTAMGIVATLAIPRFDLPPSYHDFADKRVIAGIPYFGDVLSNLAFVVVGIYGIGATLAHRQHFHHRWEMAPYLVLFAGFVMTGFGSGYYHLSPDDARLFWDRLPMTVGFMGLVSALIAERISVRAGTWTMPLLLAGGAASLVYWRWSVQVGSSDLRPYAFVQGYTFVAALLLLLMFPARYSRSRDFLVAFGFYFAAKVFEMSDKTVFDLTGHAISGHTLKHISAAVGGYWLARMLTIRERIRSNTASRVAPAETGSCNPGC